MEDVLFVAWELDYWVSWFIFVFLSDLKISQAYRALFTIFFQVEIVFNNSSFNFKPKFIPECKKSLSILVSILIILLKTKTAVGVVKAKAVALNLGIAWYDVNGVWRSAHLVKSYDFICETLVEVYVIVNEECSIVDANESHVAGSVVRIVFNAVVHGYLDS